MKRLVILSLGALLLTLSTGCCCWTPYRTGCAVGGYPAYQGAYAAPNSCGCAY